VEGTISRGTQGFDLRYARHRGLAKTALRHCLVAIAINLTRLAAWWEGVRTPRPAPFAVYRRLRTCGPDAGGSSVNFAQFDSSVLHSAS